MTQQKQLYFLNLPVLVRISIYMETPQNDSYQPRPFTQQTAEQAFKDMSSNLDDKRTLCNVLKQCFRCVQQDSHNLPAARDLLLEALWMGQRMSEALSKHAKTRLDDETVEDEWDAEEFDFCVDWSKLDGRNVAKGNWD